MNVSNGDRERRVNEAPYTSRCLRYARGWAVRSASVRWRLAASSFDVIGNITSGTDPGTFGEESF